MRHRIAPSRTCRWLAVLLPLLVVACDGGRGGDNAGAGTGKPAGPAAQDAALVLTSVDGGAGLLGQITEVPLAADRATTPLLNFEGTPWIADPDFDSHGLVFNAADNKFYGVLNGTGADRLGVLVSFDPASDKLSLLHSLVRRTWPAVTGVNGEALAFEQPNGFHRKPLLSADGKSLLLRASYGGVRDRGALFHIDIDPASASYLKPTLVYSFFDFEKSQGSYCESLRHAGHSHITEMAWGQGANGEAVVFMGVGGADIDVAVAAANGDTTVPGNCHPYTETNGKRLDKVHGRVFALKPGDPANLARPWTYAFGHRPFDPLLHLGRHIHWDSHARAVRWTTETVGGGTLDFYAGGDAGALMYRGQTEQCYRLQGLLPLNLGGNSIALCSGINGAGDGTDTPPRIFHHTATGQFSQQALFGNWYAESRMFRGATSSLTSRRLFVNGGDLSDGCVTGSFACAGGPATLEELDPATGYFQRVLATGNPATVGYNFLGDPAVGSAASGAMADRYLVWFGTVVKGYSTVLNKHDRATGVTTTLALDPKAGAHPTGALLDLGNGQALGVLQNAPPTAVQTSAAHLAGTGGYVGGPGSSGSHWGHYLLDLKTRQVVYALSQDRRIEAFSQERVRLDDGTVWEALVYLDDGTEWRTINRIDAATGKLTPTNAVRAESYGFPREPFALAGRASAALYLPFWHANADAIKAHAEVVLGCIRADTPRTLHMSDVFGPARTGLGNAHRIVVGATWSAANQAMVLATAKVGDADLGTIFEVDRGVADADVCKARPVVSPLVAGLTDVPSTRIKALKSGALVYGTANGKLMLLDVAGRRVQLVADLAAGAASRVRGYLSEPQDNVVAAVVYDHDAAGNNTARRLVTVDLSTLATTSRDVSRLISETEPYPGVVRSN